LSFPYGEEAIKGRAVRSLIKAHELGLERCESVWFLSRLNN